MSKSLQRHVARPLFGVQSIGIKFSLQMAERFQPPECMVSGHFSSLVQPMPLSGVDRVM
jgi:hypothetical protein